MSGISTRRGFLRMSVAGTAAAAAGIASAPAFAAGAKKAKELEYDVVIVGCGCAGLAAAIEAADRGAKAVVLEKSLAPLGNTVYAGGFVNAACTWVQKRDGIKDDLESFYKDMMMVSKGRGDPELTRMYCRESAGAVQWLTDRCHLSWKKIPMQIAPMLGRSHQVAGKAGPGGSQMVENMLAEVEKAGVPVMFGTKVIELTRDDMLRCTGVKALTKDGPLTIRAKGGVIIATGGFHANKELVARYMGGDVAWMPLRGSATLTGANVLLTQPFFPMYVNMDQFHAGPIHPETRANPSQCVNFGICVDTKAVRYVDERNTYVEVARQTAKKTAGNRAFIVMDSQVLDIPIVKTRLKRYQRAKAPIYKADTIEELAKLAGLPASVLRSTVDGYNKAVAAGKGASLRPVPNTMEKPCPVTKPPFVALPFSGGMTATFGGPKISLKGEVLNMDRQPVPGLYAAGNAIGGLFYDDYLSGSQLCAAVIWGRVGAAEAAARAKA